MLDDQAMAQQWIIRVQGKEYGPVDVETLREWKTEGRLLPGNEARRPDSDLWTTAADIPNLFDLGEAVATSAVGQLPRRYRPLAVLHRSWRRRFGFIGKGSRNFLVLYSSSQHLRSARS